MDVYLYAIRGKYVIDIIKHDLYFLKFIMNSIILEFYESICVTRIFVSIDTILYFVLFIFLIDTMIFVHFCFPTDFYSWMYVFIWVKLKNLFCINANPYAYIHIYSFTFARQ